MSQLSQCVIYEMFVSKPYFCQRGLFKLVLSGYWPTAQIVTASTRFTHRLVWRTFRWVHILVWQNTHKVTHAMSVLFLVKIVTVQLMKGQCSSVWLRHPWGKDSMSCWNMVVTCSKETFVFLYCTFQQVYFMKQFIIPFSLIPSWM